jgi:hypothetical protein
LHVKVRLVATMVAAVNPTQPVPASTAWLAEAAVVLADMVVAVVAVDLAAATAAAAAEVVVAAMAAVTVVVTVAVAARSVADQTTISN